MGETSSRLPKTSDQATGGGGLAFRVNMFLPAARRAGASPSSALHANFRGSDLEIITVPVEELVGPFVQSLVGSEVVPHVQEDEV